MNFHLNEGKNKRKIKRIAPTSEENTHLLSTSFFYSAHHIKWPIHYAAIQLYTTHIELDTSSSGDYCRERNMTTIE